MRASALLHRHAGDAFVVALAVATEIEIAVSEVSGSKLVLGAVALAWTLPLLARHRFPLAAPLATPVVFAAASFFIAGEMESLALPVLAGLFSAWSVGRLNERGRALVGLGVGYACVQTLTAHFGTSVAPGDVIFSFVIYAVPWAAGQAVRTRAGRMHELHERASELERRRDTAAQAAVTEERTRVARELHDVVAHSISVMTIQAGAARLLLDDEPERAEEPLLRVEETGRETLAELRRLLGVLRRDMSDAETLEPRPTLERLDGLLGHYRASGVDVSLERIGDRRALTPGVDQAAYRVVQEALTNTLKHGRARGASVRVVYGRDDLVLEIIDDGRPEASSGNGTGGGHGLVGMRERVSLYGGRLEAGPREGGGFAVRARFPLEDTT